MEVPLRKVWANDVFWSTALDHLFMADPMSSRGIVLSHVQDGCVEASGSMPSAIGIE